VLAVVGEDLFEQLDREPLVRIRLGLNVTAAQHVALVRDVGSLGPQP
jgi:hypothetical protein